MIRTTRWSATLGVGTVSLAALLGFAPASQAQGSHTSRTFAGAKVNTGSVTHAREGGKDILRLSADFTVPDTPDPHWQVVDSKGRVFLLQRLGIKGDRVNTQITLPDYVTDVAKVQIYCAWAEAVLGETAFDKVLSTQ